MSATPDSVGGGPRRDPVRHVRWNARKADPPPGSSSVGAPVRVMIAGGAGFVGSHLSRALLREGHGVVCVDDLSTGDLANIADLVPQPRYEFVRADVATAPVREVDVIAHLASPASPIDYDRMPIHTLRAELHRNVPVAGRRPRGRGEALLRLHLGGVRRSAGASAARGVLGQRRSCRTTIVR